MTPDTLSQILLCGTDRADAFAQPLTDAMQAFGVNNFHRQAALLAQIGVESGALRFMRELADGTNYEGRADLGNTQAGDGPLYRGRGLLMITGRANYEACGKALNLPLLMNPGLLEMAIGASRSAAWYWQSRGLNEVADADRFFEITKRINGGYTAGDVRLAYWLRARKIFGL